MLKFIELTATAEHIDVKRGGVITYDTDVIYDGPAIILTFNPTGDYGLVLVNDVHTGGPVKVQCRPVGTPPVKKFVPGDIVAKLAVFGQDEE